MHARTRVGFLTAAVLGLIYACGDASTDDGGSSASETNIGPSGGDVSAAALTLNIPPDALSAPVTITVDETSMIEAPSGLVLVGPAYDLGPDGTTFAEPVLVTIELGSMAAGLDLVTLYHSSNGTNWSPAENSTFDERSAIVTGSIRHFSFVAPFATAASGSGGAPAMGGTGGTPGEGAAGGTEGSAGDSSGCALGLSDCAGACVDLSNDASHCGSCETVCSLGEFCQAGQCAAVSAGGGGAGGAGGAAQVGSGGAPADICGNNVIEGTEQCDDGNVNSGDGCSPVCTIEFAP